jgi:ferrous iron transport protein A
MEDTKNSPSPSPQADGVTTLDRIPPPGTSHVVMVSAMGPVRRRLLALGFVPGAIIESVRAAPLGDPIEYRIKGYCISLRKEDARAILVTPGGI